jgi:hypothetical protein
MRGVFLGISAIRAPLGARNLRNDVSLAMAQSAGLKRFHDQ